jgi:hypothetical protein
MKLTKTLAVYLYFMIALNAFHVVVVNMKLDNFNMPFVGSITFGHMRYILEKKSKLNGKHVAHTDFERIQILKKEAEENERRRMFLTSKNLVASAILRDFYTGRF